MTTTDTTLIPPTERQVAYADGLLRQCGEPAEKRARILAEATDQFDRRAFSTYLDSLKARADRIRAEGGSTSPSPEVPAGRYAVEDAEGTLRFFVIDRPEEGRWAGYTFVNQLASDNRLPIRDRAARNAVLDRIVADGVQAAALRYGHEVGRCPRCGRTLTDEVSRARGIGPDCAEVWGIG